jgi:phosphotransacetylase
MAKKKKNEVENAKLENNNNIVDIENIQMNETNVIDVDDIKPNLEEIVESINEIDITIKDDTNLDEINEKIIEELKPINELKEKLDEITSNQELNKALTMDDKVEAEKIIKEEIKKAEKLKTEVEKIIKTNYKKPIHNVSNWWNGMNFDL